MRELRRERRRDGLPILVGTKPLRDFPLGVSSQKGKQKSLTEYFQVQKELKSFQDEVERLGKLNLEVPTREPMDLEIVEELPET